MYRIRLLIPLILIAILAFGSSPALQAQSDSHYFSETGHTVKGKFWQYWQQHGGLAQQGYPISEEFQETSDLNGQTYTVQYFERSVFEYHPENQPPNDVLLSQLGTFRLKEKYPNGAPSTGGPLPPASTPVPAANQQFSGHGSQATAAFHLDTGLVVFHSKQTGGTSNFIADLKDTSGADVALVANGIGEYQSSKAVHIDAAGDYLLNVEADGDWTISLEYPKADYAVPPATQNFSGNGDTVTHLFSLKGGLARFSSQYTGDSNFIVELLDKDGNSVDLVANEVGTSQSSKAIQVPSDGVYLLNVTASGSWTVNVQQ